MEGEFAKAIRASATLPEVARSSSYGTPSLKLRGKMLMRMKDADTVVLACPEEEKQVLLEAAPDIYFETDHYKAWPLILVRLSAISDEELHHRLRKAWVMMASKTLKKQNPEML